MIEKTILAVVVLLLIAFISAGCIQDVLTPAYLDPDVIAINGGYEPANPFFTSLFDAGRLRRQVVNKFKYSINSLDLSISNSVELRDAIFSSTSPIGMLFPTLTGLGIGWLGLSKPSDKKKLNGSKTNS